MQIGWLVDGVAVALTVGSLTRVQAEGTVGLTKLRSQHDRRVGRIAQSQFLRVDLCSCKLRPHLPLNTFVD